MLPMAPVTESRGGSTNLKDYLNNAPRELLYGLKYKCYECGISFRYEDALVLHLRSHNIVVESASVMKEPNNRDMNQIITKNKSPSLVTSRRTPLPATPETYYEITAALSQKNEINIVNPTLMNISPEITVKRNTKKPLSLNMINPLEGISSQTTVKRANDTNNSYETNRLTDTHKLQQQKSSDSGTISSPITIALSSMMQTRNSIRIMNVSHASNNCSALKETKKNNSNNTAELQNAAYYDLSPISCRLQMTPSNSKIDSSASEKRSRNFPKPGIEKRSGRILANGIQKNHRPCKQRTRVKKSLHVSASTEKFSKSVGILKDNQKPSRARIPKNKINDDEILKHGETEEKKCIDIPKVSKKQNIQKTVSEDTSVDFLERTISEIPRISKRKNPQNKHPKVAPDTIPEKSSCEILRISKRKNTINKLPEDDTVDIPVKLYQEKRKMSRGIKKVPEGTAVLTLRKLSFEMLETSERKNGRKKLPKDDSVEIIEKSSCKISKIYRRKRVRKNVKKGDPVEITKKKSFEFENTLEKENTSEKIDMKDEAPEDEPVDPLEKSSCEIPQTTRSENIQGKVQRDQSVSILNEAASDISKIHNLKRKQRIVPKEDPDQFPNENSDILNVLCQEEENVQENNTKEQNLNETTGDLPNQTLYIPNDVENEGVSRNNQSRTDDCKSGDTTAINATSSSTVERISRTDSDHKDEGIAVNSGEVNSNRKQENPKDWKDKLTKCSKFLTPLDSSATKDISETINSENYLFEQDKQITIDTCAVNEISHQITKSPLKKHSRKPEINRDTNSTNIDSGSVGGEIHEASSSSEVGHVACINEKPNFNDNPSIDKSTDSTTLLLDKVITNIIIEKKISSVVNNMNVLCRQKEITMCGEKESKDEIDDETAVIDRNQVFDIESNDINLVSRKSISNLCNVIVNKSPKKCERKLTIINQDKVFERETDADVNVSDSNIYPDDNIRDISEKIMQNSNTATGTDIRSPKECGWKPEINQREDGERETGGNTSGTNLNIDSNEMSDISNTSATHPNAAPSSEVKCLNKSIVIDCTNIDSTKKELFIQNKDSISGNNVYDVPLKTPKKRVRKHPKKMIDWSEDISKAVNEITVIRDDSQQSELFQNKLTVKGNQSSNKLNQRQKTNTLPILNNVSIDSYRTKDELGEIFCFDSSEQSNNLEGTDFFDAGKKVGRKPKRKTNSIYDDESIIIHVTDSKSEDINNSFVFNATEARYDTETENEVINIANSPKCSPETVSRIESCSEHNNKSGVKIHSHQMGIDHSVGKRAYDQILQFSPNVFYKNTVGFPVIPYSEIKGLTKIDSKKKVILNDIISKKLGCPAKPETLKKSGSPWNDYCTDPRLENCKTLDPASVASDFTARINSSTKKFNNKKKQNNLTINKNIILKNPIEKSEQKFHSPLLDDQRSDTNETSLKTCTNIDKNSTSENYDCKIFDGLKIGSTVISFIQKATEEDPNLRKGNNEELHRSEVVNGDHINSAEVDTQEIISPNNIQSIPPKDCLNEIIKYSVTESSHKYDASHSQFHIDPHPVIHNEDILYDPTEYIIEVETSNQCENNPGLELSFTNIESDVIHQTDNKSDCSVITRCSDQNKPVPEPLVFNGSLRALYESFAEEVISDVMVQTPAMVPSCENSTNIYSKPDDLNQHLCFHSDVPDPQFEIDVLTTNNDAVIPVAPDIENASNIPNMKTQIARDEERNSELKSKNVSNVEFDLPSMEDLKLSENKIDPFEIMSKSNKIEDHMIRKIAIDLNAIKSSSEKMARSDDAINSISHNLNSELGNMERDTCEHKTKYCIPKINSHSKKNSHEKRYSIDNDVTTRKKSRYIYSKEHSPDNEVQPTIDTPKRINLNNNKSVTSVSKNPIKSKVIRTKFTNYSDTKMKAEKNIKNNEMRKIKNNASKLKEFDFLTIARVPSESSEQRKGYLNKVKKCQNEIPDSSPILEKYRSGKPHHTSTMKDIRKSPIRIKSQVMSKSSYQQSTFSAKHQNSPRKTIGDRISTMNDGEKCRKLTSDNDRGKNDSRHPSEMDVSRNSLHKVGHSRVKRNIKPANGVPSRWKHIRIKCTHCCQHFSNRYFHKRHLKKVHKCTKFEKCDDCKKACSGERSSFRRQIVEVIKQSILEQEEHEALGFKMPYVLLRKLDITPYNLTECNSENVRMDELNSITDKVISGTGKYSINKDENNVDNTQSYIDSDNIQKYVCATVNLPNNNYEGKTDGEKEIINRASEVGRSSENSLENSRINLTDQDSVRNETEERVIVQYFTQGSEGTLVTEQYVTQNLVNTKQLSKDSENFDDTSTEYKCQLCGLEFNNEIQLTSHLNVEHQRSRKNRRKYTTREAKYKCKKCAKSFRYKDHLVRHFKSSHELFTCAICCQEFTRKYNLKMHLKTVHKETCTTCKLTFNTREILMKHLLTNHNPDIQNNACMVFHLQDPFVNDLETELMMYSNVNKCVLCENTFDSREELRRHVSFHHIQPRSDRDEVESTQINTQSGGRKDCIRKSEKNIEPDNQVNVSITSTPKNGVTKITKRHHRKSSQGNPGQKKLVGSRMRSKSHSSNTPYTLNKTPDLAAALPSTSQYCERLGIHSDDSTYEDVCTKSGMDATIVSFRKKSHRTEENSTKTQIKNSVEGELEKSPFSVGIFDFEEEPMESLIYIDSDDEEANSSIDIPQVSKNNNVDKDVTDKIVCTNEQNNSRSLPTTISFESFPRKTTLDKPHPNTPQLMKNWDEEISQEPIDSGSPEPALNPDIIHHSSQIDCLYPQTQKDENTTKKSIINTIDKIQSMSPGKTNTCLELLGDSSKCVSRSQTTTDTTEPMEFSHILESPKRTISEPSKHLGSPNKDPRCSPGFENIATNTDMNSKSSSPEETTLSSKNSVISSPPKHLTERGKTTLNVTPRHFEYDSNMSQDISDKKMSLSLNYLAMPKSSQIETDTYTHEKYESIPSKAAVFPTRVSKRRKTTLDTLQLMKHPRDLNASLSANIPSNKSSVTFSKRVSKRRKTTSDTPKLKEVSNIQEHTNEISQSSKDVEEKKYRRKMVIDTNENSESMSLTSDSSSSGRKKTISNTPELIENTTIPRKLEGRKSQRLKDLESPHCSKTIAKKRRTSPKATMLPVRSSKRRKTTLDSPQSIKYSNTPKKTNEILLSEELKLPEDSLIEKDKDITKEVIINKDDESVSMSCEATIPFAKCTVKSPKRVSKRRKTTSDTTHSELTNYTSIEMGRPSSENAHQMSTSLVSQTECPDSHSNNSSHNSMEDLVKNTVKSKKRRVSVSHPSRKAVILDKNRTTAEQIDFENQNDFLMCNPFNYVKCPHCTGFFPSQEAKQRHIEWEHNSMCHKCGECHQLFENYKKLQDHFVNQHASMHFGGVQDVNDLVDPYKLKWKRLLADSYTNTVGNGCHSLQQKN